MHNTGGMGSRECVRNLNGVLKGIPERQRTFQRRARDELHCQIGLAHVLSDVVKRSDAGWFSAEIALASRSMQSL